MFNYKPHATLEVRALQSEQVTYVICVCYRLIYWLGKQCSRDGERTDGVTALYSWPLCIEEHDLKQLCTIFWFKEKGAKEFYVLLEGSEVILRLMASLVGAFAAKRVKVLVAADKLRENARKECRILGAFAANGFFSRRFCS